MEKSFIVAIVSALVLTIGINASERIIYSYCECGNNVCRGVENNTAIPNEDGCEHFFICIDGHPQPYTCPPGQWFNPEIVQCDNSTNPCRAFECPEDGIHFFPHEEYCHKFIMCFAGFPIVSRCAKELYWDRKLGKCNFKEFSECKLEVCPPDNDPDNLVFIPSDKYCDKYYICYSGKPFEFWCAPDLHWHAEIENCDYPENANCTIEDDRDEPTAPQPHTIDCDEGIYFERHPNSCQHYFICVATESIMLDCAPGFWYDPINQWCDIQKNVQCDANNATATGDFIMKPSYMRPFVPPTELLPAIV